MNNTVESRKTEIRYVTNDPSRMLGKWVARRALKTWTEDFKDDDTGETVSVERNEILLERGTYISQDVLCSIKFMMQEGSLKEVEVSNQNRQGMLLENRSLLPYKAVAKIDGKRRSFLLYANSVANALVILVDYIESPKAIPMQKRKMMIKRKPKKFYQIGAHVVLHDDKEGDIEDDHTFIVQTVSAVRANMLIENWLRNKQEERFRESLKHPERTFVRYQINSFIEESKIIPIGYFIPVSFSEVYNDRANDY